MTESLKIERVGSKLGQLSKWLQTNKYGVDSIRRNKRIAKMKTVLEFDTIQQRYEGI